MKRHTKRKATIREPVASVRHRQGDFTVKLSVSQERIKDGVRYRLHGSVLAPEPGVLEAVPHPVLWSWAFREDDLDALIYFLAAELCYEVEDQAPKSSVTWVVWGDPKHVMIGWAHGASNGRVAIPRRSAARFLRALGTAADWQFTA